jgi:prolyl-tRNA synthetase
LIPTARQVPGEAEVPSHQLMLRAGIIRRVGSGIYDYLPLGLRALHKAMAIVREEMNRAGAVEVLLPSLQPIELWERTGRRTAYGENLFVVKDRHGREQALGPTHEEVITELVGGYVESYRQLPLTLYQIQTKFRDEFRPRFGVLRSREFQMKDAYSFHLNMEGPGGLDETYQAQFDAYCRIFERCGLPYRVVEAESGPIGGSASHEFMVPSPTGEDTILESDKGTPGSNYAANVEKCAIGPREHTLEGEPTGDLDKVHTPDCATIADVCKFMKVKPKNMLKTLICQADDYMVIAIVRGDHDMNEAKLRAACGFDVHLADDALARESHFPVGFVGPHIAVGRDDVMLVIDHDAAQAQFWASGDNEVDHHVKHFNWKREVLDHVPADRVKVADIRNAVEGDPSPKADGGVLRETKGIEIGHVFKLGTKYTHALDVTVLDEHNERRSVIMGCYGIGINRILAAAIERDAPGNAGHDDKGIIWPAAIAPYAVLITPIKFEGEMRDTACGLASSLEQLGIDVLIDDRDERPGVKFNDADLIGIPIRVTIGDKALKDGKVEIKPRTAADPELVPIEAAPARIAALLATL